MEFTSLTTGAVYNSTPVTVLHISLIVIGLCNEIRWQKLAYGVIQVLHYRIGLREYRTDWIYCLKP